MVKFTYISEEYYNYLQNYSELDGPKIIAVKQYLKNIISDLIEDNISNFTIFIENLDYHNKIKVFTEDFIYVLTLSNKINNKYTVWYKKKIKIC